MESLDFLGMLELGPKMSFSSCGMLTCVLTGQPRAPASECNRWTHKLTILLCIMAGVVSAG